MRRRLRAAWRWLTWLLVGGPSMSGQCRARYSAGGSCSLLPRPVPPAAPFPTLNARGRKGRVRVFIPAANHARPRVEG